MSNKITIQYGSLAKPIVEQVEAQGYAFSNAEDSAKYERQIDMATRLFFAMLLTRSEYNKVLERVTKLISKSVEKVK
jgi:hypothetical protein